MSAPWLASMVLASCVRLPAHRGRSSGGPGEMSDLKSSCSSLGLLRCIELNLFCCSAQSQLCHHGAPRCPDGERLAPGADLDCHP